MPCCLGGGLGFLDGQAKSWGLPPDPGGSASSVPQFRKLQEPSMSDATPMALLL